MAKEPIRRPVRLADFLVVAADLIHNLASSVSAATEELMQLAIYNANRETQVNNAWEEFTQELETLPEDTDGA